MIEKTISYNKECRENTHSPDNGIGSLFSQILCAALKRAQQSVASFAMKGDMSEATLNKGFLLYSSVKKDAQRELLERIVDTMGIEIESNVCNRLPEKDFDVLIIEPEQEFEDLFRNIHEEVVDEIEYYLNYAAREQDSKVHSILLMLADLSREFLFDIKIWHLNHNRHGCVLVSL